MTRCASLRHLWQGLFEGTRREHDTTPAETSARDLLEEVTLALQSIQNEIDSSARADARVEGVALHWLDVCQQSDYVNELLEQLVDRLAADPRSRAAPGPPPPRPPTAYAGGVTRSVT